ncbi:MAG: PTS sugar transporter subunit IIB [Erysipelotrichales bacterium]|nr:PTS sugar transporter subunit IIB [Erysipelotrichales bacterium]
MKKIYLLCSQGMSTSLLASMMQDCANQHKLPIEIIAYPHGKLPSIIEKQSLPDAILLGPQVKYLLEETRERFEDLRIPILLINQDDYGMLNSEKILKRTLIAMKENKEKRNHESIDDI